MKAKCPYCENGCDKCKDGYIDVYFPSGFDNIEYEINCKDCGTNSGGGFSGGDLPDPKISKYQICPKCFDEKGKDDYVQNLEIVLYFRSVDQDNTLIRMDFDDPVPIKVKFNKPSIKLDPDEGILDHE